MKNIRFVDQVNSINIEFGRGRDKQKRQKRNYLLSVGAGSVVGSGVGVRAAENQYTKKVYKMEFPNVKPTSTNIGAVRKNLLKYKLGQGGKASDAVKKVFNETRIKGGLKGAYHGAMLGSAVMGASLLYKKLKNRKTLKIAGKPVKIGGNAIVYNKPGT